jgi:predicted transcriptional regulator of viral defense system
MPTRFERRRQLFDLAATQGGYFTAAQARALGYDRRTLWYHVRARHFERESRGFYRLVEFPAQSHEDVIAAWLKAGAARAVVSHETALALYDLSPIRPRKIHLTVARAHRPSKGQPRRPTVQIHTTTRPFRPGEVVTRFGVRVTGPARTIVDAAEVGTDPSVILEAVGRSVEDGLVTAKELRQAAADRPERVRKLITRAIDEARRHATIR